MQNHNNLTDFQKDALGEIGNIGIGNATTALATMMQRKIEMKIPSADVRELGDIYSIVGDAEDMVSCVSLGINGAAPGRILFLLDRPSSLRLVDFLMGLPVGTTSVIGEMETSVLQEVGNIMSGSFLAAFCQVTGLHVVSTVPAFAHDILHAVLSSAMIEAGHYSDRLLVIETSFCDDGVALNGHFFLLPEAGSLHVILGSLGIS